MLGKGNLCAIFMISALRPCVHSRCLCIGRFGSIQIRIFDSRVLVANSKPKSHNMTPFSHWMIVPNAKRMLLISTIMSLPSVQMLTGGSRRYCRGRGTRCLGVVVCCLARSLRHREVARPCRCSSTCFECSYRRWKHFGQDSSPAGQANLGR